MGQVIPVENDQTVDDTGHGGGAPACIHVRSAGSDKTINRFVMFAEDDGETTFVCIEGQIDRDQLEKILAEQMRR